MSLSIRWWRSSGRHEGASMNVDFARSIVRRIMANPLWLVPLALAGLFVVSLVFTVLLSIFAVAAVVLGLRFYWWKRDLERAGGTEKAEKKVLEGEYIVVERQKTLIHQERARDR